MATLAACTTNPGDVTGAPGKAEHTIPVRAFLEEGPLKVTELHDTFPLSNLMGVYSSGDGIQNDACGQPEPKAMQLQAIDATHYPNPECIKPYAPAYKRYRGTVACGDEVRTNVPVFFKLTGVLDPNSLVAGKYHSASGKTTTTRARHHKERFAQNTAYTDSVASYLTSKLVEDGTCPHFPRVYGVYTGKAQKHYVEFTEEYYDHRRHTAFRKGIRDELWRMVPHPGPASDSGSDSDVGDDLLGSLGLVDEGEQDFRTFMKQLVARGQRGASRGNDEEESSVDSENWSDSESAPPVDVQAMLKTLQGAFDGNVEKDEDSDASSSSSSSVLTNDSERIVDVDMCTSVALDELESIPVEAGVRVDVCANATTTDDNNVPSLALDDLTDLSSNTVATDADANLLMDVDFLTNLDSVNAPLAATGSRGYDDQPLYLEMADVPVQVVAMEAFDHVMEDHLRKDFSEVRRCELLVAREEGDVVTANVCAYRWLLRWRTRAMERKWTALLCQICMALVVMQHRYQMVHNDLHAQNVLLETTTLTHLLYRVDGTYYRVPTYGYIVKIIDMGRTTYQLRNTVYMPDVFQPKGEAGEQYTYIHAKVNACGTGTEGEGDVSPNPAFDLSRLACSLIDEFYGGADPYMPNMRGVAIPADLPGLDEESKDSWLFEGQKRTVSPLYNLLCEWIADCYHEPVNRYENFDLYKKIARQMHSTLPVAQLRRPHFAQFITTDNTVRTSEGFYDLTAVPSEAFVPRVHTDGYHSDSDLPTAKAKVTEVKHQTVFGGLWQNSDSEDSDVEQGTPWSASSLPPFLPDTTSDQSPAELFAALLDPTVAGNGKRTGQSGAISSRRRPQTTPSQTF